jgi:hypothetical protein
MLCRVTAAAARSRGAFCHSMPVPTHTELHTSRIGLQQCGVCRYGNLAKVLQAHSQVLMAQAMQRNCIAQCLVMAGPPFIEMSGAMISAY